MDFCRFDQLHDSGKALVRHWFEKAIDDSEPPDYFTKFVYLWMSFNGWLACVTGKDSERHMIDALCRDATLRHEFTDLLSDCPPFRKEVQAFAKQWPIQSTASNRPPQPKKWDPSSWKEPSGRTY